MSDLKHRKVPKDEHFDTSRKTKSINGNLALKTNRLRFYFLTALILTTCFLGVYLHIFQWNSSYSHNASILDNLSLSLGFKNYVHVIVIDAGSTGTRVLCYGFVGSPGEKTFKLHKEFFREVKPGISSFANNPSESVKNLDILVKEAKKIIPKEEWIKTSLMMRATAGLRLLPGQKAEMLLNEARKFFKKSGFRVDKDAVSVIDGIDEGLFSWFTVNYLLDRLGNSSLRTVVALDLGGGSTQVSVVPFENDTITPSNANYMTKVAAFHRELAVFSRSYLGLGLNEARKKILQYNSNNSNLILKSECINPLVKMQWNHGGVTYTVQGSENPHYVRSEEKGEEFVTPIVNYQECEDVVKKVVSTLEKPPSLVGKDIYAFSYYYDRAVDSGLIDLGDHNKKVTVKDYISMAEVKCGDANVDQPFMCLDLIFISVLLRDGFGIPETNEINVVKYLDHHEVSWALGAAFLTLQNQTK